MIDYSILIHTIIIIGTPRNEILPKALFEIHFVLGTYVRGKRCSIHHITDFLH